MKVFTLSLFLVLVGCASSQQKTGPDCMHFPKDMARANTEGADLMRAANRCDDIAGGDGLLRHRAWMKCMRDQGWEYTTSCPLESDDNEEFERCAAKCIPSTTNQHDASVLCMSLCENERHRRAMTRQAGDEQ
jgi:hypothetical protein